jgi:hypothetical protein
MSFTDALKEWHDFFALAGGATATLIGLLFVAVSLHIDLFSDENQTHVRNIAEQILINFLKILLLSLLLIAPNQTPEAIAMTLLLMSVIGLAVTGVTFRAAYLRDRVNPNARVGRRFWLWRFVVPIGADAWLLAAGIAIVGSGLSYPLYWLMWVFTLQLVSLTRQAWNLMIRLAQYKHQRNNLNSETAVEFALPKE